MSEKTAQFRFLRYKILKSSVTIADNEQINENLNINFSQESIVENEHMYKHTLGVDITNDDNTVAIHVEMTGFFEFDADLDETHKNAFFHTNAPAILFPYIRAYVSTLTSLSGISPVILPTLNLSQRK